MWSSPRAFEKQRETASPVQRLLQERLLYLLVQITYVDSMADRPNVPHDSRSSLERTTSDALCSSEVSGARGPTTIFGLLSFQPQNKVKDGKLSQSHAKQDLQQESQVAIRKQRGFKLSVE